MRRWFLLLGVLPIFANLARAEHEAPTTDCDRFAASNVGDVRSGIPFEKIDPSIALPACEMAVRSYPRSARLLYQLGRAHLKRGDFVEARTLFQKGAEEHYLPALDALGITERRKTGH